MEDEVTKYLRALVGLQAQIVNNIDGALKAEIVLSNAGLTHKEIADMLQKSQVAVSKTISRANISQKGRKE